MSSDINVGDIVRLKNLEAGVAGFIDEDDVLTDPAVVQCIVRRAGEPPRTFTYLTDIEVVKDGTGIYHLDFLVPRAGTYYYRWQGSGGLTAAEESSFTATSRF